MQQQNRGIAGIHKQEIIKNTALKNRKENIDYQLGKFQ